MFARNMTVGGAILAGRLMNGNHGVKLMLLEQIELVSRASRQRQAKNGVAANSGGGPRKNANKLMESLPDPSDISGKFLSHSQNE